MTSLSVSSENETEDYQHVSMNLFCQTVCKKKEEKKEEVLFLAQYIVLYTLSLCLSVSPSALIIILCG